MPEVTVRFRPNGFPIAITKSPTCNLSRSKRSACRARSSAPRSASSRPTSFAVPAMSLVVMVIEVGDDMRVSQHITLRRADHADAGAGSPGSRARRSPGLVDVEEAGGKRSCSSGFCAPGYVDDARGDGGQHRRQARHRAADVGDRARQAQRRERRDPADQHELREELSSKTLSRSNSRCLDNFVTHYVNRWVKPSRRARLSRDRLAHLLPDRPIPIVSRRWTPMPIGTGISSASKD